MKKLLLILLLLTGCDKLIPRHPLNGVKGTPVPKAQIIVMAGQSNMMGMGQQPDYFPEDPWVNMIYRDGHKYAMMGPGAYAATRYAHANNVQVIGVMCAVGSTSITQWGPGSDLLEGCLERARDVQRSSGGEIIGFFWYQGEQDAFLGTPDWAQKFRAILTHVKSSLQIQTLNTVYAQLGQTDDLSYIQNWDALKIEQSYAEDAHTRMVKTDDQPIIGHVHHDKAANAIIGERFYLGFEGLSDNG